MAGGRPIVSTESLGIVDLVGICDELRRENEALFVMLGGWVATTDDPAAQQLFAEAGHRHAWHATLWSARRPAIGLDPGAEPGAGGETPVDVAARLALYKRDLVRLRRRHSDIRPRLDAVLDPSTGRVLDLVDADVSALHDRMAALG